MRIAIVGAGVAGLVCAYLLCRKYEVSIFEAGAYLGGHVHTHDVHTDSGDHAIDSGFIVFNRENYPSFCRLLDGLAVETQPTEMSWSLRDETAHLEYKGSGFRSLFCQKRNLCRPSFYRMLWDIHRFQTDAFELLGRENTQTLSAFLEENAYSDAFVNHYVYPMGSALWSIPIQAMRGYPAREFVRFFHNHGMLRLVKRPQWHVIRGGSRTYVQALMSNFLGSVYLKSPVKSVRRTGKGVRLVVQDGETHFDQVVLAVHADQALRMLAEPTVIEQEVLSAMPYHENPVALHTDCLPVLPRRRPAWASWNYLIPHEGADFTGVTYLMNTLQGFTAPEQFCVTLGMCQDRVAPDKILRRMIYHHPVPTEQAIRARQRQLEVSGRDRIHFCGAYWGFGFHEDGVRSALRVCRALGVAL